MPLKRMFQMIITASLRGTKAFAIKVKKMQISKKAISIAAQTSFMCYVLINFDMPSRLNHQIRFLRDAAI